MATIFTRIIAGELPAHFVWRDDRCVAFLSVNPLRPGHTLVVPRVEIDHWLDVPADLLAHVMSVAQRVGIALQHAYRPAKVGLMLAGLEVPHMHVHVVPIDGVRDLDFGNAEQDPDPQALASSATTIVATLIDLGFDAGLSGNT